MRKLNAWGLMRDGRARVVAWWVAVLQLADEASVGEPSFVVWCVFVIYLRALVPRLPPPSVSLESVLRTHELEL